MVLPSGETRVSSVPKANPLSPSPLRNVASESERLDHSGIANNTSIKQTTDVGSTDPRLVRNVAASSRNEDDEFCFNDTINTFTTASSTGGFVDVEVDDGCLSDRAAVYRGGSLAGRFARACLLNDVVSPPGVALRKVEMPTKTSHRNVRCSSDFSESGLSAQSETGTPNDDAQSVTDYADLFPEVSDLSMSADEQTNTSVSETGSISHSPSLAKAARDFSGEEPGCRSGNARESMAREGVSVRKTPEECVGDFDVYNIETTLPYMNWDYLEEQLQRAIEKEQLSKSQRNDREKIRQKLAMGLDDDHFGTTGAGASDRLFKKPSLQMRLHSAMNLQMCFVNEASTEVDSAGDTGSMVERTSSSSSSREDFRSVKSCNQLLHSLSSSTSLTSSKSSLQSATMVPLGIAGAPKEELDFFTRQARLQAEARLALAQVRPMAHMQLQLEKQLRRKSPIADIVGIPGFGDGKTGRLTKPILRRMNHGQLQVVVNDMHAQIEAFNVELMELLVERDDLHMAQDSMLVDIEDLTRRAQEYDTRLKSKLAGSQL